MIIHYKDTHHFNKEELENLFLSVHWESGKYSDKLVCAMKNYPTVYSAWINSQLVGMICVMDDGIMNAYIHYLLVNPDYQGRGIGKHLMEMVKNKYQDYVNLVLISYKDAKMFYQTCHFIENDDSIPMSRL